MQISQMKRYITQSVYLEIVIMNEGPDLRAVTRIHTRNSQIMKKKNIKKKNITINDSTRVQSANVLDQETYTTDETMTIKGMVRVPTVHNGLIKVLNKIIIAATKNQTRITGINTHI